MRGKVEAIIGHGINCFVNRQLIYNFPEEIFADAGVMAIEHADFDGIERLALVTGAGALPLALPCSLCPFTAVSPVTKRGCRDLHCRGRSYGICCTYAPAPLAEEPLLRERLGSLRQSHIVVADKDCCGRLNPVACTASPVGSCDVGGLLRQESRPNGRPVHGECL